MNLDQFISECKINKQRKKYDVKCSERMYKQLHAEACLHASYGKMYKPQTRLFWKQCPVCTSMLDYSSIDFKTNKGRIYINIYICNKCEYRYVYDPTLFGKELEECMENEIP